MDSRLLYEFCVNNSNDFDNYKYHFGSSLEDIINETDDWFHVENNHTDSTINEYTLFTNKFIVRVTKIVSVDCDMKSIKDMSGEWTAEITHGIINKSVSDYKNIKASDEDVEKFIIFALNN